MSGLHQAAGGRRRSRRSTPFGRSLLTVGCSPFLFILHPSSFIPSFVFWQAGDFGGGPGGGTNFVLMILQTLFALGFVCGLAYVIFRWLLPRLGAVRPGGGGQMVRVVERVGIDVRRSLLVVEVAGRWLLASSSEAGVHLVSELDPEAAREAARELESQRPTFGTDAAAVRTAFAERLGRAGLRKGGEK